MADYYSIITNRGKELEAEALASGRLIVLTHFVVGDSNGKQVKPDPAQIRLINETYRGDIAELVVSPEQSTQLMAKIVLPTGIGGFTVREVGLMTDAGELYAVANCPSIDKPVGGVSVNMQFRLAVSDTSNITLNVATGDGLFLRIDQNLKEIKARGAEAQKTSRESIGVLDGTTQQKGLVQLNSAVNNTSETQASTPAAVKIAMDNANARLAKDRNGADIPNVALFLQNLGLVETINLAAQSVQRSEVQISLDDVAAGKLLVNGSAIAVRSSYAGNGGPIDDTNDLPGNAVSFVYGGAKNSPAGNSGSILDVSGFGGGYNIQLFANYTTGEILGFRTRNGDNKTWHKWNFVYHTGNKPTPSDVGALPITGGDLKGQLSFSFLQPRNGANHLIYNGDDKGILACGYGYYQDRFDIHFYDEKGAWASNPLSIGRNGNTTVSGNLSGRAVYEGNTRVYSPNNPQPVSFEGYATQNWVLQNFVQNIDLTAPAEVGFRDGWGYPRGTDGAAMYNFNMVGGSSNVGNFIIRYMRKLVNGTWYIIN
ncbi:phage tail protein [Citrobacter cronae]|uniref:phage tail protein n=1 Tax=Citrobacter cronae TaxID=1748967 RepID=UPI001F4BCF77|nr:phage tail protein [Citrobacter cronae]